jgi:hypothetical protein
VPVQATISHDWNDIFSTSMRAAEKRLFDNIFKDNPVLEKLLAADRVETEDGGVQIQRTLEYADGSNYQRINGYTPIDETPQEIATTAIDDWRESVVNVSISRREERQNSSKNAIVNLLTSRLNNASKGFREGIAGDLLAPTGTNQTASTSASGAVGPNPLIQIAPIVRSSALENTTLHGISPTTATWWKPSGRTVSGSSGNTAWTGIKYKDEIRHTVNSIKAGSGEYPNLAVGTQNAFEKYINSLDQQVRYVSSDKGDILKDVALEGMPFIWDRRMYGTSADGAATVNYDSGSLAEEVIAFFNLDYMYLVFDSESKFKSLGFREPTNQLARSAKVVCMYNLLTTNRRAHGALYGIDVSAIVP